jgi:hypothetical protein
MDGVLVERLDLPALLRVLPTLKGDSHSVAYAEVLRLSVLGEILRRLNQVAAAGEREGDLLRLWGNWATVIFAAPTTAEWLLAEQPVTTLALASHYSTIERCTRTTERTNQ